MTKKTNSVILRLGVSSFWKNKCIKLNSVWSKFQLEHLLVVELKKIRFVLVDLIFESKLVQIFVYNSFKLDLNFSSQIKKFYQKKFKVDCIKQKLSCSERRIAFYINKKRKCIILQNKVSLLNLVLKRNLKKYLCKYLKFLFLGISKLVKFCQLVISKRVWKTNYNLINIYILRRKFRRRFGFIKLAFIRLYISILIYFVCGSLFTIWIRNVLFSTGLFKKRYIKALKVKQAKKTLRKKKKGSKRNLRLINYFLFLATTFCKSSLIGNYLVLELKRFKNHLRALVSFTVILEKLYYNHKIMFKGIVLRVTGKLGGKMRKSKYHYKLGKSNLQVIKIPLSYFLGVSATRFGILSIKVWLIFI